MNFKEKLVNLIFSNSHIDTMHIGHLQINSKNTLTTNKASLIDAGTDPLTNGEIQMNGTTIKAFFDGVVKNL